MKNINIYLLLLSSVFFSSCEEVINVDLETSSPRLVVEAAINWQIGTTGNEQKVKLSTTTGFYNNEVPPVNNAIVTIKNSTNTIFIFNEVGNTGLYICNNFVPVIDEIYTLTIVSKGQTYTATETLKSVAPITKIEQNDQGGFTGNNIEIRAYFNDPANETNYYLYQYTYANAVKSDYYVDYDEFFNGNQFFSLSENEDYVAGETIKISHYGITRSYYNFMNIVVSLAGENGGGPFQSPPATIRGNVVNLTNSSNFPLGYFSLSQVDTKFYTIE